ncbi:alpha-tocopherol transfer protein-like isoform X1 [Leptidea sinapis]|uniref:alpha-tocopherol transfer protein-like isoform X1 n=1 Tax=Leptidea sinapis TaxID=189913 RepID=UPI0021449D6A|nr:alpha-tocopherol transfer protein-like isoform X1 [Leptidea sinapis]
MQKEREEFLVEEEYKKGTGITEADVRELRLWLKTQPHLPEKYITDLDLILAYHACNHSTGITKQVLDLHFTLKTLFTPYFGDRRVDNEIETTCSNVLLTPLPTRTKEGHVILYGHLMNYDPKYFNLQEIIKATFMIIDIWQHEEGTWPGLHLVIDFQGATLRHIAKFDLINIQRFLYFLQEAILLRLRGLHYINAPTFIDKLLAMVKPFMKKELLDMLGVYPTGSEDLPKYIPLQALPKDFGGNYKSSQECLEDVLAMLRRNKRFIEEENKKRVTELLRPGKPKTISDIFSGVEGSFKKLEID